MFGSITGIEFLIVFISIVLSMSFHEAMHAFVGHALGDTTAHEEGRLTLNPLKHIDLLTTILLPLLLLLIGATPFFAAKPVPFNPMRVKYDEWGAALIALAGPLTNLFLAILVGLIVRLGVFDTTGLLGSAVLIFIQVNIGFFVFNMIPFPPLDGSRFLYAVAPEPVQNVMRQIEAFGFGAILIFMFFIYRFLSPVVSDVSGAIYRLIL